MKKYILMLLGILPLAAIAQSGHFTIDGALSGLTKPTKVYLFYSNAVTGKSITDTVISQHGQFHFQGVVAEPAKAMLLVDHAGTGFNIRVKSADLLSFFVAEGMINLKGHDSVKLADIKGSPLNADYAVYLKATDPLTQKIENLRAQAFKAAEAKQKLDENTNREYSAAARELETLQMQFIKQHKQSFISLVIIQEMSKAVLDLNKIEPLYNGLSEKVRQSNSGVAFAQSIASEKNVMLGAMAPLFTQNDVNDKPVSLIDFRGKYVLVDFWASWCVPCRAENPNVVKAYHQYKDKNFTIIGVSFDMKLTRKAWINAIKADGLEWTQVSDLNYFSSPIAQQYAIKGIPQNVLIDPTGKIIGKNLRGEELNKKLKEIFGS